LEADLNRNVALAEVLFVFELLLRVALYVEITAQYNNPDMQQRDSVFLFLVFGGLGGAFASTWVVPRAAEITSAGGAHYRTDLKILNRGVDQANVQLQFIPSGGKAEPAAVTESVATGQTLVLTDVLSTVWGLIALLRQAGVADTRTEQSDHPEARSLFFPADRDQGQAVIGRISRLRICPVPAADLELERTRYDRLENPIADELRYQQVNPKQRSYQCYYGIPLMGRNGKLLGTVCHFDKEMVPVSGDVVMTLDDLAPAIAEAAFGARWSA
jgi:hypothetical protein